MKHVPLPLKIIFTIVLVLVLTLTLSWVGLLVYGKITYADTFAQRTIITKNPGLQDGLVPQGLTWHQEEKAFHKSDLAVMSNQ